MKDSLQIKYVIYYTHDKINTIIIILYTFIPLVYAAYLKIIAFES